MASSGLTAYNLGGVLGAGILHRAQAFEKAWQLADRARADQLDGGVFEQGGGMAVAGQLVEVLGRFDPAGVDAQGHRRMLVAGTQHGFPVARIGPAHGGNPPFRVVPVCHGIALQQLLQFVLPALGIAQHGIDQSFQPRGGLAGGADGMVDDGVGCCAGGFELVQRHDQQSVDYRIGQRAFQQMVELDAQASVTPERAVGEIQQLGAAVTGDVGGLAAHDVGQVVAGQRRVENAGG